ncbi:MAG: FAD-binding protein [Roseobacter sp.]
MDEPNALFDVQLWGVDFPNVPGAMPQLQAGMTGRAVNAWPSARFDVKSALDLFHGVLPAGFYDKTFMWPEWHLFEPGIRRLAGSGRLTGDTPKDFVSRQSHDTCDLLVVGGGAAGLRVARRAAQDGQDVVLVDNNPVAGGSLYACYDGIKGKNPTGWVADETGAFQAVGGRLLTNTTAFGV